MAIKINIVITHTDTGASVEYKTQGSETVCSCEEYLEGLIQRGVRVAAEFAKGKILHKGKEHVH